MAEHENKLLDELKTVWEGGFKSINDKLEAEEKKRGDATAETKAELERANTRVDELEVKLQKAVEEVAKAQLRGETDEPSEAKKAFLSYCRKGIGGISEEERKVLVISDDTSSGFLAPPEYVREIIKGVVLISPFRQLAGVRSTGAQSVKIPKRTGVFAAQWTAETGTRSETTGLTYGMEEVSTEEMYALVDISNQDLEDSLFDLEAEINDNFTEQFAVAEGKAFINGTAVARPEGLLINSDIAAQTNYTGDANLLTADGIFNVHAALKTAYVQGAHGILNRKTLYAVRKLKDSQLRYLWEPSLQVGLPSAIDGIPYMEMPDMPDVAAAAIPYVVGNFKRAYQVVDRIQIQVQRDPYTQNTTGVTRFIARKRVGGQVVVPEAAQALTVHV